MNDMKNWIYIALIALFAGGVVACSEDDVTANPEFSTLPYDLPRGEEGSLEELIYTFYERYGSYVVYDVTETDVITTWESQLLYDVVPVDVDEYRDCMTKLVAFMLDDVFATFPDDFIARVLPRRIFLVDTLFSVTEIDVASLENHSLVIAGVGEKMDAFTDTDWSDFNVELISFVLGTLDVPREFYDLINYEDMFCAGGMCIAYYESDPEGEYDDFYYTAYSHGYVDGLRDDIYESFVSLSEVDDFAGYLVFLMSTPATEIRKICDRFEVVKNRARVIVDYLFEDEAIDIISIQNDNCPDDPLSADYLN